MNKFQKLQGKVVPLKRNDVDTDQIIPAQYLTSVSRDGYGENLFRRLRDTDTDRQFPFNKKKYQGAPILVAGYNFGCGSSREHAVWALQGAGIKVVIAESFADIFSNNSAKNGLLLIVLPKDGIEYLWERGQEEELYITVDLEEQTVKAHSSDSSERTFTFTFDAFRKHCLLNGLDDIEYIRSFDKEIEAYRQSRTPEWFVPTTSVTTSVKR